MLTRAVIFTAVALMITLSGCRRRPVPEAQEQTVKTEEQMRSEAQKEITSDNLDEQINRMEQSIDADIQTE
jgi:hypothetical protein